MNKLLRILEKPSFLRNLFLSLLALVLAITILLSSVFLTSYYSAAHLLTNRYFGNLLKQCNYSITYINDLAQQLCSSLMNDHRIVTFLNMDKPDQLQTAVTHQAVRNIVLPLSYVDSVYLYNGTLDLVLCTKSGVQTSLDAFYDTNMARRIQNIGENSHPLPTAYSVSYCGSRSVSIYSHLLPCFNADGTLASALVINISVDMLTRSLQELNANNDNLKYAVADPLGALLVQSPFPSAEDTAAFQDVALNYASAGITEGEAEIEIGNTKYLLAFTTSNSNGWYIYAMIPQAVILGDVAAKMLLCVISVLALLALFCCAVLYLARKMSRPVELISQLAQGDGISDKELRSFKTEEFRSIAAAFQNIRQENDEYSKYMGVTSRFVRKEFLESLFCGTTVYSPEQCNKHLEILSCQWMLDNPLVMCLFSIDNYASFSQTNNPREREAMRFAIINVSTELLERHFRCEMVEHGSDRFIAVLAYAPEVTPLRSGSPFGTGSFGNY